MYFSVIKKAIENLDEKRFYDVALMYLTQRGYQELSIIDGSGDGGRDVVCSRSDLRIQLSVRKDWETKINDEATKTLQAGKRHLIFLTNRSIMPDAEQNFLATKYKKKGEVELMLIDARRISTALSQSGVIRRACEMLGMAVPLELHADPKDIAISTVLLFSDEARDLHDEVIEASLRAHLLKYPDIEEETLIQKVSSTIPGNNIDRAAKSALSRLRAKGRIQHSADGLRLSSKELEMMQAAETEFLVARHADVSALAQTTGLSRELSETLLDIALELLVRGRDFEGQGELEASLSAFLAEHGLNRNRLAVFETLAASSSARFKQHGTTVDQIFSTSSFDIYRALGLRTDLQIILDASVAMPVVFGLAFGRAKSRYGQSAIALKRACDAHGIKIVVPRAYLNEMASHGAKALERLDVYNALPAEARTSLRASDNAYISHYTHIAETMHQQGDQLSLLGFLEYFGISNGKNLNSIENRIQTVIERYGIRIIGDTPYDTQIRNRIQENKKGHPYTLIDHDARVVTMIKNNDEKSFILATWDKVMIDLVEELARVYADNPARIIDFLSIARAGEFESEKNYQLMSILLHLDENIMAALARKIERIQSVEQAYKLDLFIQDARKRSGKNWVLSPENIAPFIDESERHANLEN